MWEVEDYNRLGTLLSKYDCINRFDLDSDKEAWTLAHTFLDLRESFENCLSVHFPKLLQENLSEEQIQDLLGDIGEEFRHILYHIRDPHYYGYLFPVEEAKP